MKRFLCCCISVLLVVVSSSFAVFAKGNEIGKGRPEGRPDVNVEQEADESADTNDVVQTTDVQDEDKQVKDHKKLHKKGPVVNDEMKKIIAEKRKNNDHSVPVFVKNKEVKFDVPPVIKGGRTLIPVRAITNALGADVAWYAETKTVTVTKAVYDSVYGEITTVITINLDCDIVLVNGKEVKIDVPAQMVSNRTMVPLRFIAETFDQNIGYDSETGAVVIDEESDNDEDADAENADESDTEDAKTADTGDKVVVGENNE